MADQAPPPSLTMYDPKTGQAVQVDPSQAGSLYRSGQATFAVDQDVPVVGIDGQIKILKGSEAGAYLNSAEGLSGGAASAAQFEDQELAKEYGGFGGQAKAFGAGAARGLTLGLSDVVASELGGDDARAELSRYQRYAGGAGLLGEAVGTGLGAVASGGGGLLARSASAGTRLSAGVGAAAERAAVRGGLSLGLAEGGATARALGTAASFGAEGAVYGVGSELGRQAVANEAYDGEKLVAAGLHGGLAGAALGGAGSLAASGARTAATKIAGATLDQATALAERVGGRASTVAQEGEALEEKISRLIDAVSPGGAEKYAAEKALKSTGGSQKQIGKIAEASEGVQAKAQHILETQIPEALGKERGAILSRPEMLEAMPAVIKEEGQKIGGALRRLDAAGAEGPSVARIAEAAQPLLDKLAANPFAKSEAKAVAEALDNFGAYGLAQARTGQKVTFEGLHDLSSKLGEQIRKGAMSPEKESLSALRDLVEKEIEAAGDRAATTLGSEFSGIYREAKQGYAAAKMLEKSLKTGVEREAANRTLGLSEQLGILGGLAQGGVTGTVLAAGHAYAANIARRYGDQAAAAVLREVARGRPLSQAVGVVVDQVVSESVRGFFAKAAAAGAKGARATGRGVTLAARERAQEALDDRATTREYEKARERVAQATGTLSRPDPSQLPPGVTPAAAQAAQVTAQRAATFLQGKAPRVPGAGVGLQPHLSKLRPTLEAQRKFLSYVRAVDNPASVLDDLRRGKLSPEGVEVLKSVYPELYSQVQQHAAELLASQKKRLDPADARQLGRLLGVVASPEQDPSYVAAIQAGYAAQEAGAGAPGGAGGKAPRRPVNTGRFYEEGEAALCSLHTLRRRC